MTDDAYEANGLGTVPRYAIFRNRRVRVTFYEKDSPRPFHILDSDDSKRTVTREQLRFLPRRK